MVTSFLLSLREGLEAALIIGIVLGVLHKMDRLELRRYVWRGAAFAALLSGLVAYVLHSLGAEFEGRAEELYEGTTMLIAAGLLTWMIFWMQRQARYLRSEMEANVRRTLAYRRAGALFMLAFLAVAREGVELALFLTASSFTSAVWQTLSGAILGLVVAAGLGYLLFTSSHSLSLQRFFAVSNVLLILFAAGLTTHGIHEFNEAGLIPPIIEHVWDINPIINEKSPFGQILTALFGYNGNPALTELMAYVAYFVIIAAISAYYIYNKSAAQALTDMREA